jgi:hypothetical protein
MALGSKLHYTMHSKWKTDCFFFVYIRYQSLLQSLILLDQLFDPESRTSTVYETFAKKIVLGCMEGVNGTIFAYGQTSSGKTHTMMGSPEEAGIIPLAFKDIIDYICNVCYLKVLGVCSLY